MFQKVSKEAEEVLSIIIENDADIKYWLKRFENCSKKEFTIINGCFEELKKNGLIDYLEGSMTSLGMTPVYIEILKDGYLYRQHMEEQKKGERKLEQVSSFFEYDVFISHANKDKADLIEELYQSLKKLGISIFYDKESLEWGDIWKDRILNGTKKAEFAIIVISENFFDREWTERELSEFLSRQNNNGQKLILPIIHNITVQQLKEKYPNVADIQFIDSSKYNCDEIALLFARQLIKRLKAN